MNDQKQLERAQNAAKLVYDQMLDALVGFHPCESLKLGDVLFIARHAQSLAFDAIRSTQPDA